jgi:hypothetical protein
MPDGFAQAFVTVIFLGIFTMGSIMGFFAPAEPVQYRHWPIFGHSCYETVALATGGNVATTVSSTDPVWRTAHDEN